MDFERFVMVGRSGERSRREMVRVGAVLLFLVGIVLFLTSRSGQIHFSLVVAAMIGGYMALNIGANDVANNMGPAVGANALTMGGAIVIAAVFESAGLPFAPIRKPEELLDDVHLNATGGLEVYVDGADESNRQLQLIKGGGGALTREKIVAAASKKFVCIADESKLVDILGKFPLPVEVIPMARSYVARELVALGGTPVLREGFVTDNGNLILDVHDMEIMEPMKLETQINQLAGVVTVGIFAHRPADVLILGTPDGPRIVQP